MRIGLSYNLLITYTSSNQVFTENFKFRFQVFYLALRNLILALWNINPKEHLTVADVEKAVIVRGMVRIR